MPGYRKHGRKQVKHTVKLTHDAWGEIIAETRDVSETGFFASCRDLPKYISVGDDFKAEMYSDSANESFSKVTVVRLTEEGVGLQYL